MTGHDVFENQAGQPKAKALVRLRPAAKVFFMTIGGLIALFGLLALAGLAYLYFSTGYHALGISNVGDYEVLLKKVAVDGELLYEGAYALEPSRGQRSDGSLRADRPERPARLEFKARRPRRLELSLFDPRLNKEKTVTYELDHSKGLGCVYRLRYDNGVFLGKPECE